ncbi:5-oxoprolinase subunit PxpB [Clostridium felsineum]|uniref:5-oxoprolinase subunit PxpB n=1 Tax=Clostridium felsineum TaxID=36839 RepID=UPI00098C58E2|nr:5-oxoprolinase subunit PxpB [Clostridium felsineum]URZ03873.1 5-oxoprolinase subunit B [Clostridium felsineum]
MKNNVKIFFINEVSIMLEFGGGIDVVTQKKIKTLCDYLDANPFRGMIEYVPAYTNVMVIYDPVIVKKNLYHRPAYETVKTILQDIVKKLDFSNMKEPRVVSIPVCYGGKFGPDLEYSAQYSNMSKEEFIRVHASGKYLVHMIGFAPGYPYLGGMDERIAVPRKETPRTAVPKGSVAIGGVQTGVYSISTPGGWNIIGRTPIELFRPNDKNPSFLRAGDVVEFVPISEDEYERQVVE